MALTPMMQQYMEIKEQNQDAILFFRLGDFYEMFFDDAKIASAVLNIALTGKSCGLPERAPMCGVPFHAADSYVAKLILAGYKVAICEQDEDPATAKGLVKRRVVRVVTPGTILDSDHLANKTTNYLCSAFLTDGGGSIAFCEVSTGEVLTTVFEGNGAESKIIDEITRFSPAEVIVNLAAWENKSIKEYVENKTDAMLTLFNDAYFEEEYTHRFLNAYFDEKTVSGLDRRCVCAIGAAMSYVERTQQIDPTHIKIPQFYSSQQYMLIDSSAIKNLEIVQSLSDKGKVGTLFWVLDKTKTPMGKRTLRNWMLRPLLICGEIAARHAAVGVLKDSMQKREELRETLSFILDIERVLSRIIMGSANARDLVRLRESLAQLPTLKAQLMAFDAPLLFECASKIDTMEEMHAMLQRAIVDEPPASVREGEMIREGYSEELDALNDAKAGGSGFLAEVENEERERTGIKNIKVKFNRVFGYYIEISNGNLDKVPDYYIRKQTVVNGERFITPRLKEIEGIVLGASEKIVALQYRLFCEIKDKVAAEVVKIQKIAEAVGICDALASMAEVAAKENYVCPTVDLSGEIDIKDGRHPVVEKVLKNSLFVPNDTYFGGGNNMAIITGPNMAGKSTYMRQSALIVIMAQMGSFVPAKSCRVGICDRIFTRVGASDDLVSGKSTFMVEMSEVADILKNATDKSLLILDEIGRGTSTYDGLSIAWAVLEHCTKKLGAKTLFATHYHELTQLEGKIDGVINLSIAVKKRDDDIVFLRKIIKGGADESYGIEVAKLAGVPKEITDRAKKILKSIESENGEIVITSRGGKRQQENEGQLGFSGLVGQEIIDMIKSVDVNVLSPIEAMNILYDLSKKANEI